MRLNGLVWCKLGIDNIPRVAKKYGVKVKAELARVASSQRFKQKQSGVRLDSRQ